MNVIRGDTPRNADEAYVEAQATVIEAMELLNHAFEMMRLGNLYRNSEQPPRPPTNVVRFRPRTRVAA